MLLGLLPNLGLAGGNGTVTAPAEFGDLTYLFVHYVEDLRDANPTRVDSNTLIANDLDTVVAGTFDNGDDLNTTYASYLS